MGCEARLRREPQRARAQRRPRAEAEPKRGEESEASGPEAEAALRRGAGRRAKRTPSGQPSKAMC